MAHRKADSVTLPPISPTARKGTSPEIPQKHRASVAEPSRPGAAGAVPFNPSKDDISALLGVSQKGERRDPHSEPEAPPPPGPEITNMYVLGKTLGRGAFSVVKEGTHLITGNRFAVKIIDKKQGKMSVASMQKEIAIFKRVSHPNIVRFQELYEDDRKIHIVTELVSGGELLDRIVNQGSFSEKDAARVVAEMVKAVAYLHDQGIVHRDLKPENILLASSEPNAPIKISDFGLSALVKKKDGEAKAALMKTACGTLHYCAPEVLLRKGYDNRVDFWSIGVILYIMLCGCFPFDGEQNELARAIVQGNYVFHKQYWSHISDGAKDVVAKLLAIRPDERMDKEAVLAHPWISNASDKPMPTEIIARLRRFNARKKLKRGFHAVYAAVILMSLLRKRYAAKGRA